jgi:hypothetical protein
MSNKSVAKKLADKSKKIKSDKSVVSVDSWGRSRTRYDKNGKYIKYRNKLVKGIGVCDLPTSDKYGKRLKSNVLWMSIFERAPVTTGYLKDRDPTYVDVSIDPRWYKYSGFVPWFNEHYREGFALDKDLRINGNKIYGPDTCAFVPQYINNLTLDHSHKTYAYPHGVTFNKKQNSFVAQIGLFGSYMCLGYFSSPEEAAVVYGFAKSKHIRNVAAYANEIGDIDEEVYAGLLRVSRKLFEQARHDSSKLKLSIRTATRQSTKASEYALKIKKYALKVASK